jgi:mRNA interferase RelE/StbE
VTAGRYRIDYDRRALKELSKLDRPAAQRVHTAILGLAADPRPPGCRALTGYPGMWRVRVGDHRVIYTIEDDRLVVLVLRVGHRREIYNQR